MGEPGCIDPRGWNCYSVNSEELGITVTGQLCGGAISDLLFPPDCRKAEAGPRPLPSDVGGAEQEETPSASPTWGMQSNPPHPDSAPRERMQNYTDFRPQASVLCLLFSFLQPLFKLLEIVSIFGKYLKLPEL